MLIEKKIEEMGIELPLSSPPKAMYIPVCRTGNLLFIAGQIPSVNGEIMYPGHAGEEITLEEAQEAARICVINMLSAIRAETGDLDQVKRFVKVQAFVSSRTGFDQQHIVVNAASQLLFDIFGEAGRHARTAVGVNQLPMNAPVEIEAIVELK